MTGDRAQSSAPRDGQEPSAAFGQRLRRARTDAGLTQRQLAAAARLDSSYVSLLESGNRRPTSAAVAALAGPLGVDPDDLLGEPWAALPRVLVLAELELANGHAGTAVEQLEPLVASMSDARVLADPDSQRAVVTLATALERAARVTEAVPVWERLRTLAELSPEKVALLPVVTALVRCYRDTGDKSRAVELGEAAVLRARAWGVPQWDTEYAAMVSTLAGVLMERGDHLRAKGLLDDLAAAAEEHGSRDALGYALWNAAINAMEMGQAADGRRLADRATALLAEGEDRRSQARVQVTRAWVLLGQDPPEASEARRVLRGVLPSLREESGVLSLASAEVELARCELVLGRPEVAQRHARSALSRLAKANPDPLMGRARALTALGASLVAQGEEAAGTLELERAAEELGALDASPQAAAVWRQLSGLYAATGALAAALHAATQAMDSAGIAGQTALLPSTSGGRSAASGRSRSSRPGARH